MLLFTASVLQSGHIALVYNPTNRERYPLRISLSEMVGRHGHIRVILRLAPVAQNIATLQFCSRQMATSMFHIHMTEKPSSTLDSRKTGLLVNDLSLPEYMYTSVVFC